jgi:hypothetical protein
MLERLRTIRRASPEARNDPRGLQVSLRLLAAAYRAASTLPNFRDAGFRIHSQNDEDGILHLIFSIIGAVGLAVEIGCGDGVQNNTTNLIVNQGWHGLLIDADPANIASARTFFTRCRDTMIFPPAIRQRFVTSENANEVVAGFEGEIDLLSLDIDSIDYWVLNALTAVNPRVIVAETPTIWGPEFARSVPNSPRWNFAANPDFYGASLGAFDKLLRTRGYRFVGTSKYGTNSFFIRGGLGEDAFPVASLKEGFRHPRAMEGIISRSQRSRHLPWVDV